MTLPHEVEIAAEIAETHRAFLDGTTQLHDAVVSMLTAGEWKGSTPDGIEQFAVETTIGLLVKAVKTFRAIQILCERGLADDAQALLRVLLETSAAIVFILQHDSNNRALIFHAYGVSQKIKMANHWNGIPKLKGKIPDITLERHKEILAGYKGLLPEGTDVERHWSGLKNLQQAMQAIEEDAKYATIFRLASSSVHVSDFAAHFEVKPGTDTFIWQLEPVANGWEGPASTANELLIGAALRINERFGLGFDDTLAPWKVLLEKGKQ